MSGSPPLKCNHGPQLGQEHREPMKVSNHYIKLYHKIRMGRGSLGRRQKATGGCNRTLHTSALGCWPRWLPCIPLCKSKPFPPHKAATWIALDAKQIVMTIG